MGVKIGRIHSQPRGVTSRRCGTLPNYFGLDTCRHPSCWWSAAPIHQETNKHLSVKVHTISVWWNWPILHIWQSLQPSDVHCRTPQSRQLQGGGVRRGWICRRSAAELVQCVVHRTLPFPSCQIPRCSPDDRTATPAVPTIDSTHCGLCKHCNCYVFAWIQKNTTLEDGLWRSMSTWMPFPYWRPAVTLTSDLQNLMRSSLGASEYSLSGLSKLFKAFMMYRGNNLWGRMDRQTNGTEGQPKNIMPLPRH